MSEDQKRSPSFSGNVRLLLVVGVVLFLCMASALSAGIWLVWQSVSKPQLPLMTLFSAAQTPTAEQPLPTSPPPTVPALANNPNRIVLIANNDSVVTVNPDGSQRQELTNDSLFYQFPAWSPNGKQIAVLGGDSTGVGVFLLEDKPANQFTANQVYFSRNQSPFYFYWAPNSNQIAILANHPTGLAVHLALANSNSPSSSSLLATGQPFYWAWAPDSNQILIHSGANQPDAQLAFVDVEGQFLTDNLTQPGSFQAPGISASGNYWSFTAENSDGQRHLVVQNGLGLPEKQLPHIGSLAQSWSPAAEKLAFFSPVKDETAFFGPLRLLDLAIGETQLLTEQTVVAFFWSPDGEQIAYLTLHGLDNIEAFVPAKSRRSQVAQNISIPQLDLWVVKVATQEVRLLASFEPTPLFVSQFLPFFDQYALSHHLWSPASDAIVLPVLLEGESQIMVVKVPTGISQIISEGMIAFWSHH